MKKHYIKPESMLITCHAECLLPPSEIDMGGSDNRAEGDFVELSREEEDFSSSAWDDFE